MANSVFPPSSPVSTLTIPYREHMGPPLMKLGARKKSMDDGNGHKENMGAWDEEMKRRRKKMHLIRMLGDSTCPPSTVIILPQCGQWTDTPPLIPLPRLFFHLQPISCHFIILCQPVDFLYHMVSWQNICLYILVDNVTTKSLQSYSGSMRLYLGEKVVLFH